MGRGGKGKGKGGGRGNRAVSDVGKSWLTRWVGEGAKMKKFFKLGLGFVREWERGGYV